MQLTETILLLSSLATGSAALPSPSLIATTSLLLSTSTLAAAAPDDDGRPNAVYKINIHAHHSSDDSSDDEEEDEEGCLLRNPDKSCQIWNNVQHFRNDFGQLEFKWSSCDDPYDDSHDDFEEVSIENSLYQRVIFEENLMKEDKCLRLDSTLQQCSSYRPHYHEPFVHYSASYLNEGFMSGVKRVVFVGGGDSMLLHEVLKYKGLEMVLGLELDQKVTRNSFEHFKTQPHFSNPKVQWWFGDGAKSLTLLPRSYFGTFDLVLLDLSETVMSMTVTKGLDVFGAMKLLLSDTGIMVKNDFGYFEKLSKVFDTCIQLLIPDVTYICDYELVLCGSDKVDFLNPTFHHLKGGKGPDQVETFMYKPLDDIDDHWGPVIDYSKYWGEPRKCDDTPDETDAEEEVAYAGVLLVLEAENVSFKGLDNGDKVAEEVEKVVKKLGYEILSTTIRASAGVKDGAVLAVAMKEGYILAETWPEAKYCKLDIHLWGNFEKQEDIRAQLLKSLGVKAGDFSNYRIVTTGMRGLETRANDLKTVGPDLAKIGQCEEVKPGSNKSILANSSYKDEVALQPVIDAGYEEIISLMLRETKGINAIVFCNVKGAPCRAKDSLVKQGFTDIVTMWSCMPEEEKEMDSNAAKQGEYMQKWRQAMKEGASEFTLCGKKVDVALREVATKMNGVNLVVVDAVAPSTHVTGCHQYYLKFWKTVKKPFLFLVPILDANDQHRNFFLKSRYNHAEEEPEYYSEIFLGNGEKTMSFGLIHEGHSTSLQNFMRAETVLKSRKEIKFAEIRKITIRGAMRQQVNYEPKTFSWDDYDQQPGLKQFYGQQPIGLQSMSQWGLEGGALTAASVKAAIDNAMKKIMAGASDKETFHEIGEGALYIALLEKGQVAVTWDGAAHMNVNVFTYDEKTNHGAAIAEPIMRSLPKMNVMLRDEQPRGYGGVINTSDRINRDESPECYDHYKMCTTLKEAGNCSGANNADVWMKEHCRFSCGICGKNSSSAKSEL
ncbi:hypothetical protein ACHAWO_003032 [Cyclotella atomus]|uniref:ShKT domain-containing protein n=1 Tax=Cyclotella atomus TaxID=382360 RepID=A0ABD3NNV2_9STRA